MKHPCVYLIFSFFFPDFSIPADIANTITNKQSKEEEIKIISSALGVDRPRTELETELKTNEKKAEEVEHTEDEEVQRRRMYSHLMLNPSYIPLGGHANSIRPQQGFHVESRNSTNLLGKCSPPSVLFASLI